MYNAVIVFDDASVEHHGVKGMKWGVRRERRYQKSVAKTQAKSVFTQIDPSRKENAIADLRARVKVLKDRGTRYTQKKVSTSSAEVALHQHQIAHEQFMQVVQNTNNMLFMPGLV